YRREDHRHTVIDYRQYERRVIDMLSSGPHLRAALLRGGIIWRLVTEFAKHHPGTLELLRSYVDLGPSEESTHHLEILKDDEGRMFVDDALADWEMDVICGVNKVYTQANQSEDRSWWPKQNIWRLSGMYTGIWTPGNEEWFKKRLADIRSGTAYPMNVRRWKSALGQYRPCAKVAEAANVQAADALDDYL
ncbi:hypothetical protein C8Q76DRAFT_596714, partial [Earliella scabrosa]